MRRQLIVLTALIISSRLLGQDSTRASIMDEVVVTATKYPVKTSTTGKVMLVINRQQLEQSGGKELAQILAEQSGMIVNGSGNNPGKDKSLYLRGARVDHTLITIDGIPVYDAAGIGGNFDIRNLSVDQIERIEILKGSQSTLYGSDAIAGVINIITRKGGSTHPMLQGLLQGGSFGNKKISSTLTGTLKKMDYSIGYTGLKQTGIDEALHDGAGDKDGFKQQQLQVQLGFKPIDGLVVRPFFRSNRLKGDLDQGAFIDELDYTYDQKSMQTGVKAIWTKGRHAINLLYQYNTIDRFYKDDSLLSRNGYDTYSTGSYKGQEHFADLYWAGRVKDWVDLTAGMDLRRSRTDQTFTSIGSWSYGSAYGKDSLHQQQLGVYASALFHLPKKITLELGDRLNMHSGYGAHQVFSLNPSILVKEHWKLYANLSSGYRTPSLYQMFSQYGNKDLKPEQALTKEVGVQYTASADRFQVRATWFDRSVRDMIFFYYNASTWVSQYINQDRQKDHGLELEGKWQISKKVQATAFYNYLDGTIYTKAVKDTSYHNLLRRPKHSVGGALHAQINERLLITSRFSYIGARQDSYYDINSYSVKEVTLSAYALCDVYAEYALAPKKLKAFVDLRNVTDRSYVEISGFRTLGRAVYAGIRWSL